MKNKKDHLVEASWELFFKTGDPFYLVAKNTFDNVDKKEENKNLNANKTKEENNELAK